MGLDLSVRAVRLDSASCRAIRGSVEIWDEAVLHPPFGGGRGCGPLPAVNREMLRHLPEEFRLFRPFPGRTQEQAEYLLDPVGFRRVTTYEERGRSVPHRIVFGDRPFADHARGGQGVPWRCSASRFLAEAAARIDAVDAAAARREFSVADMVDQAVYKAHPDADDDEAFTRVLSELRALARWYRGLADHGLDAIVEVD
jgi:hypothetical protein